jgi:Reverse transcriptase (RNA-dependent DNA polymerase)
VVVTTAIFAESNSTLWGVAALKCILLRNLVPNARLGRSTSPHMMVYGLPADIRHRPILDFGASVEVLIDKTQRDWKFGARAEAGWYIGPDMDVKDAIQCYLPKKNIIVRRRDFRVTNTLPTDNKHASTTTIYVERESDSNVWLEGLQRYPHALEGLTMMCDPPQDITHTQDPTPAHTQRGTPSPTAEETTDQARARLITEIAGQQLLQQAATSNAEPQRAEAARVRRLKLEELLSLTTASTPTRADKRRLLVSLRKLKQKAGTKTEDSPTLTEALRGPNRVEWLKAIEAEVKSVYEDNKCFEDISIEVHFPANAEVLPSHFVLKRKRHADGTLEKYKARLVANGSRQPDEIYSKTTSPTARALSVNILLCIAASDALFLRTFDVKTAFLHSELPPSSNPIYIRLPIGEGIPHGGAYAKLRKSIYGLRQAPELWYTNILETLLTFGFTQTISDECLFVYHTQDGEHLYASLHVDDLLCVATTEALIDKLGAHLQARYGEISESDGTSHLGLKIDRDLAGSLRITQPALLDKLFAHTNIDPTAHAATPYLPDNDRLPDDDMTIDIESFQVGVGMLNYLTNSRPDIRYPLSVLAASTHKPTCRHWRMMKQVATYLQSTRTLGVTFHHGASIDLHGFVDASYASASEGRSQTGLAFKISPDSAVVTSQSLIQTIVALSSTEAELDGLCKATTMATAIRILMHELGRPMHRPTILYEDNKSTIALTQGPGAWSRTKHFKVRYHHIKLAIKEEIVSIKYCPTNEQLADLFTKPLPAFKFTPLRDQLLGIKRSYHQL